MNLTVSSIIIIFISVIVVNSKFTRLSPFNRALLTLLMSWVLYTMWYAYLSYREDNYGIVMHEL